MKPTARPWEARGTSIYERDKAWVATTDGHDGAQCPQCEANAAHIVKAVNLHDELVDASRGLVALIENAGLQNLVADVQRGAIPWYLKMSDSIEFAKRVLAKAEGRGE